MNDKSAAMARLLAAVALTAVSSLAHAQFKWIDEKGLKHYSDRPPPTTIPMKDILQAPGQPRGPLAAQSDAQAAAKAAAEPAAPSKPAADPTVAERNADFRKRVREQAEKDEKAQQESEAKKATEEYCARMRETKVTLDSGRRIATTDKNGESGYMDDARRAQETKRANTALAECK